MALGTAVDGTAVGDGVEADDAALTAGFGVAVGEAAVLLLAVLEDGLLVVVGSGLSQDGPFAAFVAVAVGDDGCEAGLGEFELPLSLLSSGAAGGGFRTVEANGREPPLLSTVVAVVSGVALLLSKNPSPTRPAVMVRVPPATNPIAIALGVMTFPPGPAARVPWRPRPCGKPKEVFGRPSVGCRLDDLSI